MLTEKGRAGQRFTEKGNEEIFRVMDMSYTLNGMVVTGVCILFTTYPTVYLRSVHLSALYFNEVISIEKMGKVSSDNSINCLFGNREEE